MLLAAIIKLTALRDGRLPPDTRKSVEHFWWQRLPAALFEHASPNNLFTYTPLMGEDGALSGEVIQGIEAVLRITTLAQPLSDTILQETLPGLPERVEIAGIPWQIGGFTVHSDEHPWAGQTTYQELVSRYLVNPRPPRFWWLSFIGPTQFQFTPRYIPIPSPKRLVDSWLHIWQRFGTLALPDDILTAVHESFRVRHNGLRLSPLLGGSPLACYGTLGIHAGKASISVRAAVDTLAHMAFFTGSGYQTHRGFGFTLSKALMKTPLGQGPQPNWWLGE